MKEKELKLDKQSNYSICVNQVGIITKVSSEFANLLGYTTEELINERHNIVWHPDMPKIIFKLMWEKLHNGEKFIGFIKHQSKSGDYCWLSNKAYLYSNEPNGTRKYFSYKGLIPMRAKYHIDHLYSSLLKEEETGGIEASEKYLNEYLNFRGVTYDEYIETFDDTVGVFKVGYFMTRKLFS
ncbi:PAS domain-containing protein [Sulfurovum sp. zt1-1]|uniref:PAS domain-containing protein n=1 Tax=Sulfurovum zhangzhouensis TaxID=3019067 RepID=A0ABT7R2K2_9BACT|nr:PAS domain-containing protein [Sulfurovum zhangzhouensis]MDM5272766.1 PAS domain-containing protein [Sulfurovum zhangzhouensis]